MKVFHDMGVFFIFEHSEWELHGKALPPPPPSSPFHSQKGSWQGIGDWSRANYWWRCYHLLLWWIYQLVYLPTSSGSNQNNHFHGLARLSSFLSWASVWGGSLFVQSKYQDDTEWCQKESYTSIPSILESSKTQIQLELVPYYVASLFFTFCGGTAFSSHRPKTCTLFYQETTNCPLVCLWVNDSRNQGKDWGPILGVYLPLWWLLG